MNRERSEVNVKVCFVEQWDLPKKLEDAIAFLQEKLEEIPQEFRPVADCDFDRNETYGSYYSTLEISYWRPETDKEWAARLAEHDQREAARAAQERATYLALKAKFET